jgi:hypothetical protein
VQDYHFRELSFTQDFWVRTCISFTVKRWHDYSGVRTDKPKSRLFQSVLKLRWHNYALKPVTEAKARQQTLENSAEWRALKRQSKHRLVPNPSNLVPAISGISARKYVEFQLSSESFAPKSGGGDIPPEQPRHPQQYREAPGIPNQLIQSSEREAH